MSSLIDPCIPRIISQIISQIIPLIIPPTISPIIPPTISPIIPPIIPLIIPPIISLIIPPIISPIIPPIIPLIIPPIVSRTLPPVATRHLTHNPCPTRRTAQSRCLTPDLFGLSSPLMPDGNPPNLLYYGDNLDILRRIADLGASQSDPGKPCVQTC